MQDFSKTMSAQVLLSAFALFIMFVFGMALIFHELPQANRELMIYILGSVSGALTVAGGTKALDKLTATTNPPSVTASSQ